MVIIPFQRHGVVELLRTWIEFDQDPSPPIHADVNQGYPVRVTLGSHRADPHVPGHSSIETEYVYR